MSEIVQIQKNIDEIKRIIFRGKYSHNWSHISMVLPKFYKDGSGRIDVISDDDKPLFEFDGIEDFIYKSNKWIRENGDKPNDIPKGWRIKGENYERGNDDPKSEPTKTNNLHKTILISTIIIGTLLLLNLIL